MESRWKIKQECSVKWVTAGLSKTLWWSWADNNSVDGSWFPDCHWKTVSNFPGHAEGSADSKDPVAFTMQWEVWKDGSWQAKWNFERQQVSMASSWEAGIMWLSTDSLSDYFWILHYLHIKCSIKKFIGGEEKKTQHTILGKLKILILAICGNNLHGFSAAPRQMKIQSLPWRVYK